MGQVTLYLEEEIERKMIAAAKSAHLSKSKWISGVIRDKVASEWPQSIAEIAGTWNDFPSIKDLRESGVKDTQRESM